MRRRALIVEEGRSRGALAAARGLHGAGWSVGIAAIHGELATHSRAVTWHHAVPAPAEDPERFLDAVNRACERDHYRLVFATDDADLLALSELRDRVAADVPYPPHEAVCRATDKAELEESGRRAGFGVPRRYHPGDELPDEPLVVKARLRRGAGPRPEVRVASGADEARRLAAELAGAGEDPIVQERVEGRLAALTVVSDRDGRIVAAVQQEASRLFPAGAGMSARAVTVPVDGELLAAASRLVADLSWFGLAQLQLLVPDGGEPALVDFNGRFYGSLSLALGAGVNLPAIWADLAVGDPAPRLPVQGRPGVRYQWFEGDLRRALTERRGGLLRDVADVLRRRRGTVGSIWDRRDPRPAVRHAAEQVRRATGRQRTGRAPG